MTATNKVPTPDFIVIDTEGKDKLSEVAVINSCGKIAYEAFCSEQTNKTSLALGYRNFEAIIADLSKLMATKKVVFHYAEHDIDLLRRSFNKAKKHLPRFSTVCSFEIAKQYFPNLPSHSLAYLSKHFNLKVDGRYFDKALAHTASYDACFTYQLYQKLKGHIAMVELLQNTANPFSSSRVDTPFQQHLDFGEIYHSEFEILTSALTEVKGDPNQQSKGAVVIGEAGSGKTHLMMRLARERLKTNRLLFIRQPNNPNAVLYHTYARILESFAERIPSTGHTQLEQFLTNSFTAILRSMPEVIQTARGQETIAALETNGINLYSRARTEGATKFRETWEYIWRYVARWWTRNYTTAGYVNDILRGIIKFCSYTDQRKKHLVMRWLAANELPEEAINSIGLKNWRENISREEFALEAMAIFGKLSVRNEPLIIVFDQLEGLSNNSKLLENFGSAIKEMLTYVPNSLMIFNLFPDRWVSFQKIFDDSVVGRMSQYEVHLSLPEKDKLKEILNLKAKDVNLKLETIFSTAELTDVLEQRSIRSVLNRASAYYRAKANNLPLPTITTNTATANTFTKEKLPTGDFESRLRLLENDLALFKQALGNFAQTLQPFAKQVAAQTVTETLTEPSKSAQVVELESAETKEMAPNLEQEIEQEILDYLEQKRAALEKVYDKPNIIADSDELGKLVTIIEACQSFKTLQIEYLRLGKATLPEHLLIKTDNKAFTVGFLNVAGNSFTTRLQNFNQLMLRHDRTEFYLVRDARQPAITGKVGKAEIEKLKHSKNGTFLLMDKEQKLNFELAYNLIVDIQNRDLEAELENAFKVLITQIEDDWLFEKLTN